LAANKNLNTDEVVGVYQETACVRETARRFGVHRKTVQHHLRKKGIEGPIAGGSVKSMTSEQLALPESGVKRYILTCAQNNTRINKPFWNNLLALAVYYEAEVHVSRFTYNKNAFGKLSVKPGSEEHQDTLWYAPELNIYVSDESLEIAPGLVWCGEMNILPTAVRPLSGLETYTRRRSGIFPHVKVSMQSVASGRFQNTKFNYTTGTVTQRNYIKKKEGLKAEFHHQYAATLVEVDASGDWFVRQISSGPRGEIQDLNCLFQGGKLVRTDQDVEAIFWGDLHAANIDDNMEKLNWGDDGIAKTLKPKYQFINDGLDNAAINPHKQKDPHELFKNYTNCQDSVQDELKDFITLLIFIQESGGKIICSYGNHDDFLNRWLKWCDYRDDPKNALLFLRIQLAYYEALDRGDSFNPVRWAMEHLQCPEDIKFLDVDDSYTICKDSIECGWHGHLGPNGSRGSAASLHKIGRKLCIGHSHSACIIEGLYQAGTSCAMDQGYNNGPSSWSHTHIIIYPNGQRTLLTCWNGKWRGE